MKPRSRFLRIVPYVTIVGVLYAAAFLTFEQLFKATHGGSYFQNVVVVLLGTVLTVIVTAILLSEQSQSEENKDRHVAVFGKMVTRYERMTLLLARAEERDEINSKEKADLLEALFDMSLFCSPETLDVTAKFLRAQAARRRGDAVESPIFLFEVIARFRKDMGLPLAKDSETQLISLERELLASGVTRDG